MIIERYLGLIFLTIGLLPSSCRENDTGLFDESVINQYLNLPPNPHNYTAITVPDFLDKKLIERQDNTPITNEISDNGATLGRVLFYDKNLSLSKTISCASCHQQQFGFSDTARFSVGHAGDKTKRHSMALANSRFRTSGIFFWDGRASALEVQVLKPIQDATEMNLTLTQLIEMVEAQPYYPILFKRAFGTTSIDTVKIAQALAQFVRSMQSFDSKYDQGRLNDQRDSSFTNFSTQENLGKSLFFNFSKGNCAGCHYSDAFVMDIPRNNGLVSENTSNADIGYLGTTGDPQDLGKFIAPSLRNIGVRPPYMHDGRFATLGEVVSHYSESILWSETLDPHLLGSQPNTAKRFNLNNTEKEALVAFLNTLTDNVIFSDERFSDPFIR
ncbi:MAG: cytochrome c peroxidase [Bacteroidia bacterium]|jgi:cytochrome c peroxidase